MESSVGVHDYAMIDIPFKEKRQHILEIIKRIATTGENVLPQLKTILTEAVYNFVVHLKAEKKIMFIKDIDRNDDDLIDNRQQSES